MIMETIIELKSGISYKVPENCNVKIENGVVVFEAIKHEFKMGDFLVSDIGTICIYETYENERHYYIEGYAHNIFVGGSHFYPERYATPEERQLLLDKLHEVGKDWDDDKKKIVDLVWKPKDGDVVFTFFDGNVEPYTWDSDYNEELKPTDFRTRELAEAALEMLRNCKHY